MRALILNRTLKKSPAPSNTEKLAGLVADALREHGVTVESVRIVDHRVAGVVVTGDEDGAHHVISEINGALVDIGYTIPGQSWTYWNMGPGPGPDYSDVDHGHEWSAKTAKTMAANLYAVATALTRQPIPAQ
ncbi:hypothetical protein [Actinophytocola sp.]|uniref:hypothetical protein n=1 Tax=Actinophytocola sp. TaxID=1872138 RepID=UPI00389A831E